MQLIYALNLGTRYAALADLRADLVDSLGEVIATYTSGYTDLGEGQYLWTLDIPAAHSGGLRFYSQASPSTYFATAAINASETEIPGSVLPDAINAYLYCYVNGQLAPNATVSYRLLGVTADYTGGAYSDDTYTTTANEAGLAQITMQRGAYYQYWIGNGRSKTVLITATTADPYELPAVTG